MDRHTLPAMIRFAFFSILVIGLATPALLTGSIQAQTPDAGTSTPTATQTSAPVAPTATATVLATPTSIPQVVCPPNRPAESAARTVRFGELSVSLPSGRITVVESPTGSSNVTVCYDLAGGVRLSGQDCAVLGRTSSSDSASAILDQVVASCSIGSAPAATATPVTGSIRVPDTGDAGLK